MTGPSNYGLKEDIRDYWSRRSETFDLAFGHRIPKGPEFAAWQSAIRSHLGAQPLRVLELACGTGEVTHVLLSLGHQVAALDFSEAMLETARRKHAARGNQVRFVLGDAENSREPDDVYDAVVCRHLVWTLTEPAAALADWLRVLKTGASCWSSMENGPSSAVSVMSAPIGVMGTSSAWCGSLIVSAPGRSSKMSRLIAQAYVREHCGRARLLRAYDRWFCRTRFALCHSTLCLSR